MFKMVRVKARRSGALSGFRDRALANAGVVEVTYVNLTC